MNYNELFSNLTSKLGKETDPLKRLKIWNQFIFRQAPDNPEITKQLYIETDEFADIIDSYPACKADYLFNRGMIERCLANYSDAHSLYSRSLKLYETTHNKRRIALTKLEIGIICNDHAEYPEALAYLSDAKNLFRELKMDPQYVAVLSALGSLNADSGDPERAIKYYREAMEINDKKDDDPSSLVHRSYLINNLSAVYIDLEQFHHAIDLIQEALTILAKFPDPRLECPLRLNLGTALFRTDKKTEARDEYRRSLVAAKKYGSKRFIMSAIAAIGEIYQKESEFDKARKCYEKAMKLSYETGRKQNILHNLNCLVEICKLQNKFEEACMHLEKILVIQEEIFNEKSISKLKSLQIKNETKELEDKIKKQKELDKIQKEYQDQLIFKNKKLKRLEYAIQCSGNVIVLTDSSGCIQYANPRFEELTGYSLEEALGQNPRILQSGYHDKAFYKNIWDTIMNKDTWKGEFRNKRKDGSLYWEHASISPVIDDTGNIMSFVAVKEDITDKKLVEEKLKESLREKEILLKEIHHRVKNNLAVVSSLLDLQAMSITEEPIRFMFTECQNRIHSIALVHTKLYQSDNFGFVNFGEYLENLVTDLQNIYGNTGIETEVICEEINLDLDTAIPLGLIVNELVTNSMKHAFPETNSGKIHVEIGRKIDNDIELIISDDGVGFPENTNFDTLDSLGLQLVTSLTDQIDGKFSYQPDNGSKFIISFSSPVV